MFAYMTSVNGTANKERTNNMETALYEEGYRAQCKGIRDNPHPIKTREQFAPVAFEPIHISR